MQISLLYASNINCHCMSHSQSERWFQPWCQLRYQPWNAFGWLLTSRWWIIVSEIRRCDIDYPWLPLVILNSTPLAGDNRPSNLHKNSDRSLTCTANKWMNKPLAFFNVVSPWTKIQSQLQRLQQEVYGGKPCDDYVWSNNRCCHLMKPYILVLYNLLYQPMNTHIIPFSNFISDKRYISYCYQVAYHTNVFWLRLFGS